MRFKNLLPLLIVQSCLSISVSGIMLNMVEFSNIIWRDSSFHSLEMGLLLGFRTFTIALSGLLLGRLTDRISRKKLMIGIFFIIAIARFLNGFAPSGTSNAFGYFIFCYILNGIGQGGFTPIIISFTNDVLKQNERSRFFGIFETLRQISQIAGMVTSAWLIQSGLWREYFWGVGILLFLGCGSLFFLKEPKRGFESHADLHTVLTNEQIVYNYTLTKKTIKSTFFSPTNLIALVEGIFTWIIFSTALYMLYPYIQSPPYNISPFMTSIMMIIFGLPGAIIGSLAFSKVSDRLGNRNIMNRAYLISFSIIMLFFTILAVFIIPLPELSPDQGNNFVQLFALPMIWILGLIIFLLRGVLGIYNINQTPILQKINLPEAQGSITAWNQFIETIGYALGPIIAGAILTNSGNDYLFAAIVTILIGIPSAFLWIISRKWIYSDVARIQNILKNRANELNHDMS